MRRKIRTFLIGPDIEENLSLRYLSGALHAAGFHAVVVPFNEAADMPRVIRASSAGDVVGLSLCFQVRAPQFLELARKLKQIKPSIFVVAGGHFASCAARDILPRHREIDLVAVHEGERTIVDIVRALAERRDPRGIAGTAAMDGGSVAFAPPRPVETDLDTLPWPDREGPPTLLAGVPSAYLMGSRGCRGACAYCCITTLHRLAPGPRFRQRSVGDVVREMAGLYHERGIRQFIFHDDNFLVPSRERNLERLEALETGLARRGVEAIGLVIKCRPGDADPDVFARLRRMGLLRVFLGIESASDEVLRGMRRRQTMEDAARALAVCSRLGISVQYTIMIFHPWSTVETVRRDIAFMKAHLDYPLNFCRTEIYAGTPLEREMRRLGRARGSYMARVYTIPDPVVETASRHTLRIFLRRNWSNRSLKEMTIGMDHLGAVLGRFYDGPEVEALRGDIRGWMTEANRDTVELLDELVELCAADGGARTMFEAALRDLERREALSFERFHGEGRRLGADLEALVWAHVGLRKTRAGYLRPGRRGAGMARHAAAVLLALGLAGGADGCRHHDEQKWGPGPGVCEYAAPPLPDLDGDGLPDPCETEIFRTSPRLKDSDGDGIEDGDEDSDMDGWTNRQEQDSVGNYACSNLPPKPVPPAAAQDASPTVDAAEDAADAPPEDVKQPKQPFGVCEYAATPLDTEPEANKK
jgi:anaerobic magnesium-protoporphyrin IX monomethyl ester cyclase